MEVPRLSAPAPALEVDADDLAGGVDDVTLVVSLAVRFGDAVPELGFGARSDVVASSPETNGAELAWARAAKAGGGVAACTRARAAGAIGQLDPLLASRVGALRRRSSLSARALLRLGELSGGLDGHE